MKFLKRLLLSGLLVCGVGVGVVHAADSNIRIVERYNDRMKTSCKHIEFFRSYTENNLNEEIFSGSSTTSGGTSTFSAGVVDLEGYQGTKEFSLLMVPTTGGSITVKFYAVNGTDTFSTGTNTSGVAELFSYRTVLAASVATSTTVRIVEAPRAIAVSVTCTSGTPTVSVGMTTYEGF